MMLFSGPGIRTTRYLWPSAAALLVLSLVILSVYSALAAPPGNEHFQRTWQRTDQPVLDGLVARTWMWGPEAFTDVVREPYAETPGGERAVQYFDKARMEITNPDGDAGSIWYVTNGLLVVELVTGNMQTGDADFEPRSPAQVNVAGDADDPTGPTYATFGALLDAAPLASGATISQRVDREGDVTNDPALSGQGLTVAIVDEVTNHGIAGPFWDFMNASGTVYENGQFVDNQLFENPYFATGRPISEAYWANVKVAGTYRDVLMQCFERRCLTYTPGNPEGFVVEAGNVGQHYYAWRYTQTPVDPTPTATAPVTSTATGTVTASPTVTATATVTATMTATVTTTPTETPASEYSYTAQWGKQYQPFTALKSPVGVAVDSDGHLWTLDTHNHRLIEYDENGVYIRTVGSEGAAQGQFEFPVDAAFSADGRLFVTDQGNNRVQVFNSDGEFQTAFGSLGAGNGQFDAPTGIAISGQTVYVTDLSNDRIQFFNLDGVYQGQFTANGMTHPSDIAVAPDGLLYVTDYQAHVIWEFNADTSYRGVFGGEGSGTRQFKNPSGIVIDADGYIYIAENGNERVQVLAPNTAYFGEWGSQGFGLGQLYAPRGLALDNDGNIYVADYGNSRIQKFTTSGQFLFEVHDASRGQFGNVLAIAQDRNGYLLTIDANKEAYDSGSISRYTADGIPLDVLSSMRPERGQYDQLAGVAVNLTSGEIYVTDRISNRIQRFSATWQYLGKWGTAGTGPGQFNGPTGIAIDADGYVYVADAGNNRVQKFDANGVFLDQWGGVGSGNGQFVQPAGIVTYGERIYVSDNGNHRVQVFDRDGDYLGQWGGMGAEPGQFNGPAGVAVTSDGKYVLVVDVGNNRVQIFSPEGMYLASFGTAGSDPGQFNVPYGIAIDAEGNAYVTDLGNYRVQKFSPTP